MYSILPTAILFLYILAFVGAIAVAVAVIGTFIYARKTYILLRDQTDQKARQSE
jgi:lipid-A-disaccharide synthase-like uncharacterized protein